jgi:hypothetical protein
MSKSTESKGPLTVSQQIQQKLSELAELVSMEQYGAEGPPKDLTFRQIENVGYEVGKLAAAKFESMAAEKHGKHFEGLQPCPQCGCQCEAGDPVERKLLTRLGPVNLVEVEFHCNACRRSFFPSA